MGRGGDGGRQERYEARLALSPFLSHAQSIRGDSPGELLVVEQERRESGELVLVGVRQAGIGPSLAAGQREYIDQ